MSRAGIEPSTLRLKCSLDSFTTPCDPISVSAGRAVRLPPRDRLHLAVTNREIERSGLAVRALYAHYVPRAAKTVDRGTRVRIAREPGGLL